VAGLGQIVLDQSLAVVGIQSTERRVDHPWR
jgi:hypothetical protein